MKAKIEGREAITNRLMALVPKAQTALAQVQLDGAKELAERIRGRAPTNTGVYRKTIQGDKLSNRPAQRRVGGKLKRTPTGKTLDVTKDKHATGIFAEYIWRFLEFGTVKMGARPHIFPTFRAFRKKLRRDMAKAVNREVRAFRKGRAAVIEENVT